MGIFRRGNVLWMRYRTRDGTWTNDTTGLPLSEMKRAKKMLERVEAQIVAGLVPKSGGPLTVSAYVDTWVEERKLYVGGWKNDHAMLRDHVLPTIGKLPIADVRARHLVELARVWRGKELAPKSRYNVYSTCCALFRDAQLADLVEQTPCVLTKRQLGEKADADGEWRATAVFTCPELEQLISDPRIPHDRRVLTALAGIAAPRLGEVVALRWRHVDMSAKPLGKLIIAVSHDKQTTKTKSTRHMPVHPTLAAMLAEWKATGWLEMFGRTPGPDDLVLPRDPSALQPGTMRSKQYVLSLFQRDLDTLGLRRRRFHDLRRTMISLARADGALKDILRRGTHTTSREVLELYTSVEWEVLCREVLKLQVHRRDTGKVIRMVANTTSPRASLHPPLQSERTAHSHNGSSVLRPGLEPRPEAPDEYQQTPVGATFEAVEAATTADDDGLSNAHCNGVTSALAELLELGSAALEAEHPAMKRAAAVLPDRWLGKRR